MAERESYKLYPKGHQGIPEWLQVQVLPRRPNLIPPWRNWYARPAVNGKVPGSTPGGGANLMLPFAYRSRRLKGGSNLSKILDVF